MTPREEGLERLHELAPEFLTRPDVAIGRMFHSDGLSVRGKFFAFVTSKGMLAVKVSEERIEALGLDNMIMRGRATREWAVVPFDDGPEGWRQVAEEAYAFVEEITPR